MPTDPIPGQVSPTTEFLKLRLTGVMILRGYPLMGQPVDLSGQMILPGFLMDYAEPGGRTVTPKFEHTPQIIRQYAEAGILARVPDEDLSLGQTKELLKTASENFQVGKTRMSGEFRFEETKDETSLMRSMSLWASFQGKCGIYSGRIAVSKKEVERQRTSKHVVYGNFSIIQDLPNPGSFTLSKRALDALKTIDKLDSPSQRREVLVSEIGTHYVAGVRLGYGFYVRAESDTNENFSEGSLAGFLNAKVGGFLGAKTDVSLQNQITKEVSSRGISIEGKLFAENAPPEALFITSVQQVFETIQKLHDKIIEFAPAPIEMDLAPLKTRLPMDAPELKNIASLFIDGSLPPIAAGNGVPRGTIIPWVPPLDYLEQLNGAPVEAPVGWAICDAETANSNPNVPNLSDLFLRGVARDGSAGVTNTNTQIKGGFTFETGPSQKSNVWAVDVFTGGDEDRTNGTLVGGLRKDNAHGSLADKQHSHLGQVVIDMDPVPKYLGVIYLIKL